MAGSLGDLFVHLGLDARDFTSGISGAQQGLGSFGSKAGAALGAIGGLAVGMGQDFATGTNNIIKGTGASGEALKGLQQSMTNIAGSVPQGMDEVGQAIGDVNTRLGLTGPALESTTKQFLDLARVTGTDVSGDITDITRLFGDWSVATQDQSLEMDKLLFESQATGVGVNELAQTVVEFGAPMRALGLSVDEATALIGKWAKEGVNSTTVLSGMKIAVANFAKQGIDPAQGFPALIEQLKGMNDEQGLLAAKQIVGQRAANDFFRAVKEGRFDVEDATAALEQAGGTISDTADRTLTLKDRFDEFMNTIASTVGPVTGQIGELGLGIAGLKPILAGVGGVAGAFAGKLLGGIKGALAAVASSGPIKAAAGAVGGFVGNAISAAQTLAETGIGALRNFLAKFGIMTGEKVAAAAAAGTLEGAAEGEAAATAATGPGILARFKSAGGAMGGALSAGFALVAVAGVVAATIDATNKINAAQHQVGTDLKSFLESTPTDAEVQARIDALKKVPDQLDPVKRALFELDVSGVKSTWQGSIDALSKYLQMDAAQRLRLLSTAGGDWRRKRF